MQRRVQSSCFTASSNDIRVKVGQITKQTEIVELCPVAADSPCDWFVGGESSTSVSAQTLCS